MSEPIKLKHGLLSRPVCASCGDDEGVQVFEIVTYPDGNSHQVVAWCPPCARKVAYRLNRVFPEPLPEWIKAMQNIGKGGDKDEHSA